MTEPKIVWYWDAEYMLPDALGFSWERVSRHALVYAVRCRARVSGARWSACRVEFFNNETGNQIQQTMDTLLDVCRMRYADELLNQGEMK